MKSNNYFFCMLIYSWAFLLVWVSVSFSLRGMVFAGILLPIFVYLKYVNKQKPLSYLMLSGQFSLSGLVLGFFLGAIIAGTTALKASLLNSGTLYLLWPWEDLANIVVGASLVEEILFRGLLLQKLIDLLSFFRANIVTSLLFTAIHLPTWLADGFTCSEIYSIAAYIFAFSLVLGYVFYRSRSLWAPIAMHAANNYAALAALGLVYTSPYL